jgi:hypothetical protein
MNNHKLYLYRPGGSASDFLGELLVDNLNVNIKLHEMSTITFTIPEKINNIANTRLDEVLDGYIIELWYGQVDGVYNPPSQKDFEKIRFILHKTPLDFNDFKRIYSYEGYSVESNLELRQITNWAGVFVPDFYRSITYNNSTPNQYTEVAATGKTIPNHPYIITAKSPDTGSYIKIAPTTATATPLDIYVYEVRENTDPADIRYNEIAYVRYNSAGVTPYNESGFKQGYYFLKLDNNEQYVEYIYIYVPDNYDDFDAQSGAAYKKLRFKVYDNPISRHYAIGVNRNSENPFTDYYIDLAQDVEDGAPAQYGNYTFTTKPIRSKNGLKLEHALLGNIQTRNISDNIDNNTLTDDGLLYNTDFTIGTIDPIVAAKYRSNLEFNNTTVYQAIRDIAESFDAIAVFDTIAKTVSFYPENATTWPNNGLILKYGTYLKNISNDIDASKIVTAAKAVGKDNSGIELITPDGNDYWEDFSYYLDEFYIDKDKSLTDLYNEGFDFTLENNPSTGAYYLGISYPDSDDTSSFDSRWMDAAEAKKLAKWQFNRDFLHNVLLGEFLPSNVDGSIGIDLTPMNRFYDLYNLRSEAINDYVQSDRVLSERKAEYFRYKNFYDFYEKRVTTQVALTGSPNPTDQQRYVYYKGLWEFAQTQVTAQETIVENKRLAIFTTTVANSIGDKLNEVRSALNKSTVFSVDLNKLKSFIKESVVTDSKLDNDFDLLEAVITHVNENKIPRITLNVGIVNILAAQESYDDWNKLRVGDLVNVYFPEFNINEEIQIREVAIDFEQHTASLVIASVRTYNKSRGTYVSKTMKQLLRTNKNNLNNIEDFSRVTNTESEETYSKLNGGTITPKDAVFAFGAINKEGEYGNKFTGSGGSLLVVSDVDPLTETFEFSSNKSLFILDGSVQSFYDAGTHVTQVEVSGENGFVIRKITGSVEDEDLNVVEQVYIDTNGNAVFAGSIQVGSEAYNQIQSLAGAGTTVFKAGTIEEFDDIDTANINDLLLITATFTDPGLEPEPEDDIIYTKDDIYRYDLVTAPDTYGWVLAADLKTKITGSVGGWTINSTDIEAKNEKMRLHSDSDQNGRNPYISIGQDFNDDGYEKEGIFLGVDGETGTGNGLPKLSIVSSDDTNFLKWTGSELNIKGQVTATSGNIGGWFIDTTRISKLYDAGLTNDVNIYAGEMPLNVSDTGAGEFGFAIENTNPDEDYPFLTAMTNKGFYIYTNTDAVNNYANPVSALEIAYNEDYIWAKGLLISDNKNIANANVVVGTLALSDGEATNWGLKVNNQDIPNNSSSSITIDKNGIEIVKTVSSVSTTTFSVDTDGNAFFAGSLVAATGTFGAVSIASGGSLTLGTFASGTSGDIVITDEGIVARNPSDEETFSVNTLGVLTATGATINGEVNATSGTFSGVTITGQLDMGPSGDIIINGGDITIDNSGIYTSTNAFKLLTTGTSKIAGFDFNNTSITSTNFKLESGLNPYLYFGSNTVSPSFGDLGIFLGINADDNKTQFSMINNALVSLTFEESFTSGTNNINGWFTDTGFIYNTPTNDSLCIISGQTPTSGTGPLSAKEGTKYLYIETTGSGAATVYRNLYRTITSTKTNRLLTFYYNAHGSSGNNGFLEVGRYKGNGRTSTTSHTISSSSKQFTISNPESFWRVNDRLNVISTANRNNYMSGQITAITLGSVTLNIDTTLGSGTFANWQIISYTDLQFIHTVTGDTNWKYSQLNIAPDTTRVEFRFYLDGTSEDGDIAIDNIKIIDSGLLINSSGSLNLLGNISANTFSANSAFISGTEFASDGNIYVSEGFGIDSDKFISQTRVNNSNFSYSQLDGSELLIRQVDLGNYPTKRTDISMGIVDLLRATSVNNSSTVILTSGDTTTSSSSNTIGSGSRTFAFASNTNPSWRVGTRLRATVNTTTSTWMEGIITALTTTSVTFTSDLTSGSGTYTSWSLSVGSRLESQSEPLRITSNNYLDITASNSVRFVPYDGLGINVQLLNKSNLIFDVKDSRVTGLITRTAERTQLQGSSTYVTGIDTTGYQYAIVLYRRGTAIMPSFIIDLSNLNYFGTTTVRQQFLVMHEGGFTFQTRIDILTTNSSSNTTPVTGGTWLRLKSTDTAAQNIFRITLIKAETNIGQPI